MWEANALSLLREGDILVSGHDFSCSEWSNARKEQYVIQTCSAPITCQGQNIGTFTCANCYATLQVNLDIVFEWSIISGITKVGATIIGSAAANLDFLVNISYLSKTTLFKTIFPFQTSPQSWEQPINNSPSLNGEYSKLSTYIPTSTLSTSFQSFSIFLILIFFVASHKSLRWAERNVFAKRGWKRVYQKKCVEQEKGTSRIKKTSF